MHQLLLESVGTRIRMAEGGAPTWLWCLRCQRFFEACDISSGSSGTKSGARSEGLRSDEALRAEQCPLEGCRGSGLGRELFLWDDLRPESDPRWPTDTAELATGRRSPPLQSKFTRASAVRCNRILRKFLQSEEFDCLIEFGYDLAWTRPLLEYAEECGLRWTEITADFFYRAITNVLPERHPMAAGDALSLAQELRAFWMFAVQEQAASTARDCLDLLGPGIETEIAHSLRGAERSLATAVTPPTAAALPSKLPGN